MISSNSSANKILSQPSQSSIGQYQRTYNQQANNANHGQMSLRQASPIYQTSQTLNSLSNSRQHSYSSSAIPQMFQHQQQNNQQLQVKTHQQVQQQQQYPQYHTQQYIQSSQNQQFQQVLQSQYQYNHVPDPQQQQQPPINQLHQNQQQQQHFQQQFHSPIRGQSSPSLFSSSHSLQPRMLQSPPQQQFFQNKHEILQLKDSNSLKLPQKKPQNQAALLSSAPRRYSLNSNIPIKQLKYEDVFRRQRFSEQNQQDQEFEQFQQSDSKTRSNSLPRTQPTNGQYLGSSQVSTIPLRVNNRLTSPYQQTLPKDQDPGLQLYNELKTLNEKLNHSTEEYQLAFSSKRMTRNEISQHKNKFRLQVQETHINCKTLIGKYPTIFNLQEQPGYQTQSSLNRAIPGSTFYERDINHFIDLIDETYHQYMVTKPSNTSQSTLPVAISSNDNYTVTQQYLKKQDLPLKDIQSNSMSSGILQSPIDKAFHNSLQIIDSNNFISETTLNKKLNFTAVAQNNNIQNNFQHENIDFNTKGISIQDIGKNVKPLQSFDNDKYKLASFNETIIPQYSQQLIGQNTIETKKYITSEYISKLHNPLNDQINQIQEYTYVTDYDINRLDTINIQHSTKELSSKISNPGITQNNYLNKVIFSTTQLGVKDYQPITLKNDITPKNIVNSDIYGNILQNKKYENHDYQEKKLKEEAESLQKFEESLDINICEYSYQMLSEMDRKIIQIKCTIQQALEQTDLPMTKQLLLEILDSLAETANTADQSLASKAVLKIQKNAARLHKDSSTSYNLYIYLQKISNFLQSRANILELSQQAHELSLLNQTEASFWQHDYINRPQKQDQYLSTQNNQNSNKDKGIEKVTLLEQKYTKDVSSYTPMEKTITNQVTSLTQTLTDVLNKTEKQQDYVPSHYSPVTLKKNENNNGSNTHQIIGENQNNIFNDITLQNQIILQTANPQTGLEDSSRHISMYPQRQSDFESQQSNYQILSSAPFGVQNEHHFNGRNVAEQVERTRIQSYAITNQISELNQAKQIASQASAQEEFFGKQTPTTNTIGIQKYPQQEKNNQGLLGNKMMSTGISNIPFAKDSNTNNQGSTSNNMNSNIYDNKNLNLIDLTDDLNNNSNYQYSSSRPPAMTRRIGTETNLLTQQSQKPIPKMNKDSSMNLLTQTQSGQSLEQPHFTSVSGQQQITMGQDDLSFAVTNTLNYTASPSGYQITQGVGNVSARLQPFGSVGNFDTERELPKQDLHKIPEESQSQIIMQSQTTTQPQQNKMKFFDIAVKIKERYPRNHPALTVLITQLWESARTLPENNWEQFIKSQFDSAK